MLNDNREQMKKQDDRHRRQEEHQREALRLQEERFQATIQQQEERHAAAEARQAEQIAQQTDCLNKALAKVGVGGGARAAGRAEDEDDVGDDDAEAGAAGGRSRPAPNPGTRLAKAPQVLQHDTSSSDFRQWKKAYLAYNKLSGCLLYTSPSPRDLSTSRMPSSA